MIRYVYERTNRLSEYEGQRVIIWSSLFKMEKKTPDY